MLPSTIIKNRYAGCLEMMVQYGTASKFKWTFVFPTLSLWLKLFLADNRLDITIEPTNTIFCVNCFKRNSQICIMTTFTINEKVQRNKNKLAMPWWHHSIQTFKRLNNATCLCYWNKPVMKWLIEYTHHSDLIHASLTHVNRVRCIRVDLCTHCTPKYLENDNDKLVVQRYGRTAIHIWLNETNHHRIERKNKINSNVLLSFSLC